MIPEIGIFSSGRVFEFLLPSNHLCQACSGPGLCEIPVSTFQLPSSRKMWGSFRLLEVKLADLKVEEHLLWGRSQHNQVCTGGILFCQFTIFLYLAESDGWVQQEHFWFTKTS